MPASEYLKNIRNKGYSDKPEGSKYSDKDKKPEGHSRTLSLTDDEKGYFEGAAPGTDVSCQVTGKLGGDGKLMVMTISPVENQQEDQMAQQVAQRVMPGMKMG